VNKRILALDLGEKRVGVAISDPSLTIAKPLDFLFAEKLFESLQKLLRKYECGKILLGLPISMDGREREQARRIREQARSLEKLGISLEFVDERLTSVEANRVLNELGVKKKKIEKDFLSAQLFLQNYLDAKSETK